jgi:hypothetical protein
MKRGRKRINPRKKEVKSEKDLVIDGNGNDERKWDWVEWHKTDFGQAIELDRSRVRLLGVAFRDKSDRVRGKSSS